MRKLYRRLLEKILKNATFCTFLWIIVAKCCHSVRFKRFLLYLSRKSNSCFYACVMLYLSGEVSHARRVE